jgi:hypothetical protein
MKTLILLTSIFILSFNQFSQDINGKLGTNGQFIIRDTSGIFLSIHQANGDLSLRRSLMLPVTTPGTVTGTIYRGFDRFIHTYQAPGTNGNNTFIGINSGNFTMSGSGFQASYSTAVGNSSMSALTTGQHSSAFGYNSLRLTKEGDANTGFGSNTLSNNVSGSFNTAIGTQSLLFNSLGNGNTGVGMNSLFNSLAGNNSALGYRAGYNLTTGSNNTIVGYDAQVPINTGSNQVRIGNTAVIYAGIQVAWTITSDRRWKENIKASDLGLGFISKLKPVSYTRINDENVKTEYGFIAQEVEETLKQAGVENTGMLTIDDEGKYELRYNDLFAPMVKAIQELNDENDKAVNENAELKSEIKELKSQLTNIENYLKEVHLTSVKYTGK